VRGEDQDFWQFWHTHTYTTFTSTSASTHRQEQAEGTMALSRMRVTMAQKPGGNGKSGETEEAAGTEQDPEVGEGTGLHTRCHTMSSSALLFLP